MTDTIIVGGGHNGLVCAAYLAKAGQKVIVLEAAEQVGGAAITREFATGFRVSGCAHLLYLQDEGLQKDLGLKAHGLRMAKSGMATIALDENGKHIHFSGASVEGNGVSDADKSAMAEYHRSMSRFAGIVGGLNSQVPPRLGTKAAADLFGLARLGWNTRKLGRDDMREFLRVAGINVYDILQENFDNELLKGALSLDGVLGTFLGTRSNNSVFCALQRMSGGGVYSQPQGGMGAVSEAIASAARQNGADIRTSSPVKQIMMDFDHVCGVELEDGEQLKATTVVSSADPKTTFNKLLGTQNLEAGFANKIKNIRSKGHVAKLHLALSGLPELTGLDEKHMGERLVIAPSLEYVEHAFNHAKYGEYSSHPVMEINLPSVNDDSLAPPGQHVLSANVQWAPVDLKQGWTDAKPRFTEVIIDEIARYAPGIRSQIQHVELLTPADIAKDFRITGGHWHHGELAMDQFLMMRPAPGAAQYAAPVDGLWLCGAGSHPGGGVMGCAGRNAANAIIKSNRA